MSEQGEGGPLAPPIFARSVNMNFARTVLILVIFLQFCDATEITKKLRKQVRELKTKYDHIQQSMGMYTSF